MTTRRPRHTEPSANAALADLLKGMLPGCVVRPEQTRLIAGRPGLQLDNLVTAPDRAPVVVEAEYLPAHTVEAEAAARLGLRVVDEPNPIEAAVALRYPADLGYADDLRAAITAADLSYCVLTQDGEKVRRFPAAGWLTGAVTDLADLIRLISVPQRAVTAATEALEEGIDRGVALLHDMAATRPGIVLDVARLLGMTDNVQTRRMACAIVTNALLYHERLAGRHAAIKPLHLVCGPSVANPQRAVADTWRRILDINYWAVFAIARDIVEQLPPDAAAGLLRVLRETAQRITASGAIVAHDLTGRLFQRLIADRKYLATFYTRPESAALLARLAVAKLDGVHWADADALGTLRIGDFACGTGALLSAVYEQVAARHERAGGDPACLHPVMMEDVLYGCDVMPSAIHITGSTLSGVQPAVHFGKSRLYTLAYGRQSDGSVRIGSLELLQSAVSDTLFNTSDPAKRTGSVGEETAAHVVADIPDAGFDLVVMNPPFTRATNHEGAHAEVTNPAFAAFDATSADQSAMGTRINAFGKHTCSHGNAGIASAFAALADRKLKPGGVLALVLPLSAATGLSWQGFRQMLAQGYTDLDVLSIAAATGLDMAFSADTGMAECLVIARKLKENERAERRIHFASLHCRPQGFAHAAALAKHIAESRNTRKIDDGPYGGTPLMVGDESAGEMLSAPSKVAGEAWGVVRVADCSLAQTAHVLSDSKLWLSGSPQPLALKIARLGAVGTLGLVDRDIIGPPPRGPFTKAAATPTATYPALWKHDAAKERRMTCEPDSSLHVRQGMEAKAAEVWKTASRAHFSRGFRFNSQPLAAAFTDRESLGGRAWPNVIFEDERFDYAFSVWSNGTLGLFSYWWHSNRQVGGRGEITIRSAESLPVLDFRTLSDEQLVTAEAIFDDFRDEDLLPAYLADADPNRAALDRRVVCDLLGFDEEVYRSVRRLAAKWCAEPSVHGGKVHTAGALPVA